MAISHPEFEHTGFARWITPEFDPGGELQKDEWLVVLLGLLVRRLSPSKCRKCKTLKTLKIEGFINSTLYEGSFTRAALEEALSRLQQTLPQPRIRLLHGSQKPWISGVSALCHSHRVTRCD